MNHNVRKHSFELSVRVEILADENIIMKRHQNREARIVQ